MNQFIEKVRRETGMTNDDTLTAKIMRSIKTSPGITGTAIQFKFRPTNSANSISSTLGRLHRMGVIENRGNKGRFSKWYPVETNTVDTELLQMADWLIEEMKKLPRSERALFLALRIADLTGEN